MIDFKFMDCKIMSEIKHVPLSWLEIMLELTVDHKLRSDQKIVIKKCLLIINVGIIDHFNRHAQSSF